MEDRMTAQKLKNSILQMAVQGKLVPQDPNDEPASVLLERIRKEKEQLIKEGKIKRNKNESYIFRGADNLHYEQIGKEVKCIEDELPFEIPDSWCWSRFSSLYSLTSGQDLSPDDYNSDKNGVAYITGASNITDGKIDINRWTIHPKSMAHFGDLLFTCKGTVGKMAFLNVEKAHIARQIMSISSPYNLDLYYLKLVLKTNLNSIKIRAKSMIPGISRIDVLNIFIPLPPIGEQNRIVEKIKELEPLINKYKLAEEKLYKLNSNIKEQLKKSILQYAIEGKLVPQDPNDEPASALLERIYKKKEKLIAEGKIKKDKNESVIYRRDNSYYEKQNYIENCIDDELPFEIPDSWRWTNIETISLLIGGKDNQILTKEIMPIGEIPVVSQSKKLIDGYCNNEDKKIDILPLVMFGDHTRNVKYIDFEFVVGADGTKFHKIILCNAKYIYYWMKHSAGIIRNRGYARHYSLLKECYIPLPPIQEQYRIVNEIETVLSKINTL